MTCEQIIEEGGISTIIKDTPDDLLFLCASYEPRTLSIGNCLNNNYSAKNGLIFHNDLNVGAEYIKKNLNRLTKIVKNKCSEVFVVEGILNDPVNQFRALKDEIIKLNNLHKIKTVTIDITTFNREALLIAIALLRSNCKDAIIRTLYVSPEEFAPWLSRGFREVRTVIGFPGIINATWPTTLIILTGFESDRVEKIIEEHQPDKIMIGIGNPPTESKFLDRNLEEQQIVYTHKNIEKFYFPADDIITCHHSLEKIISGKSSTNNIIIAPMSTKLSTLGVFLTAESHPEIQLTYCVPGEYNMSNYSRGAVNLYLEYLPQRSL